MLSFLRLFDPDRLRKCHLSSTTNFLVCSSSQGNGISRPVQSACSERLRINMVSDVDSLSVPIAAGIILHGLREKEKKEAN